MQNNVVSPEQEEEEEVSNFLKEIADKVLFGGNTRSDMLRKHGLPEHEDLDDFLPSILLQAKSFASVYTTKMIKQYNLYGTEAVVGMLRSCYYDIRLTLLSVGIVPEDTPPSEDIKEVERRLKKAEAMLIADSFKK